MIIEKDNFNKDTLELEGQPGYTYKTEREELTSNDIGSYVSYGVSVYCENIRIIYISDISSEREVVEDLVYRCNKGRLDPIHLRDVIDDILGE